MSSEGFAEAGSPALDPEVDDILFVVSLPCTGGSNWQKVNAEKSGMSRRRINKLINKFLSVLFAADVTITNAKREKPGCVEVVFELPQNNAYWKEAKVIKFLEKHAIQYQNVVHGCAAGLVAANGLPIKKPWLFKTTAPEIHIALDGIKCSGDHEHQICEGSETKPSGHYPHLIAVCIHTGFRKRSIRVPIKACPGKPAAMFWDHPAPTMPVSFPEQQQEQREILPNIDFHIPSLVARKVPKKEASMNKAESGLPATA